MLKSPWCSNSKIIHITGNDRKKFFIFKRHVLDVTYKTQVDHALRSRATLNYPFIRLQALLIYVLVTCVLVHQDAMFYNLTLSDSKYSALLLSQEWLERHCFNGTKVQWFSLMHGNGCQQAFSSCTTIRALSLVGGWLASHHTELQCCQVSHITYEAGSTYPFPKYQGWY